MKVSNLIGSLRQLKNKADYPEQGTLINLFPETGAYEEYVKYHTEDCVNKLGTMIGTEASKRMLGISEDIAPEDIFKYLSKRVTLFRNKKSFEEHKFFVYYQPLTLEDYREAWIATRVLYPIGTYHALMLANSPIVHRRNFSEYWVLKPTNYAKMVYSLLVGGNLEFSDLYFPSVKWDLLSLVPERVNKKTVIRCYDLYGEVRYTIDMNMFSEESYEVIKNHYIGLEIKSLLED